MPLLAVLAVLAVSPSNRPPAPAPANVPVAFDGAWAAQELSSLAREFPVRPAGSRGDDALAQRIAQIIEALGRPGGGFHVSLRRFSGLTRDGERSLATVVASRAGSTGMSPIVVVAHRDASGYGSRAELSGTAALLELARVFTDQQTNRTIVLVSTSGGSGGDAGAEHLVSLTGGGQAPWSLGSEPATASQGAIEHESSGGGPEQGAAPAPPASGRGAAARAVDAVLVLGDLASPGRNRMVIPYSDGLGGAPVQLVDATDQAVSAQAGLAPGSDGLAGQLVHLALPLTQGEQGVFNAAGLPAVMIQASGETGPGAFAPVSAARLEGLGNAALATIDALDAAAEIPSGPQAALYVAHKVVAGWVVRMLVVALLFPALVVTVDAFARARRRRYAVGEWLGLTLSCALPFALCAMLMFIASAVGVLGADPGLAANRGVSAISGRALAAAIAGLMLFAACWLYWRRAARARGLLGRPWGEAAGVAVLIVANTTALVMWLANPFAALAVVPAVHVWMVVASPELRPRARPVGLALVLFGICGPALVALYYATHIGGGAWAVLFLPANGHVGIGMALLWCLTLGCMVAAALLAVSPQRANRGAPQSGSMPLGTVRPAVITSPSGSPRATLRGRGSRAAHLKAER
ncbi:MAG: M28 family peptidase [Solirubrobacteraceae bacterium]